MRLSTRIALSMVALVVLTAAVLASFSYYHLEAAVVPFERKRLGGHTQLLAELLSRRVQRVRSDLTAWRGLPMVHQLVEAHVRGGQTTAGLSEDTAADLLAEAFRAILDAEPEYYKLRFIGAADGGRELVRVDRRQAHGAVRIVPNDELQQKGQRPFYTVTTTMPAGVIHVSPVELNQDDGVIETPHVPVIRAAAPIHTPSGEFFGSVVSNLDLRLVFDMIRGSVAEGGQVFVVNERGDYLVHPRREMEFAFEFGTPLRIQDDWPDVAAALRSRGPAQLEARSRDGRLHFVNVVPVPISSECCLFVIQIVPRTMTTMLMSGVRRSGLLAGLATVGPAVLLALFLSRSISQPLVRMTRAVHAFGCGAGMSVPVTAPGEVGELARAFEKMAVDVRDKTLALQSTEALLRETNTLLAKRVRELVQSNSELQQFAYVASHDLQTPLRTISGFVQLLQRGYGDKLDAQARDWIERSVSGTQRMQQLIQGLLAYSRVGSQAEPAEPVDLNDVMRVVCRDSEALIREHAARVTWDELPTVMGSRPQLVQLLMNLVGNALKYHGPEPPQVHVSAQRDGSGWRFAVKDNGIGIDPRHHQRVFEIFRRLHTEREYPGMGIGLALCQRITHRHGGRIWVESAAGAGSTFYFTIPSNKEHDHDRELEAAPSGDTAG